jgi:hypothetical protein
MHPQVRRHFSPSPPQKEEEGRGEEADFQVEIPSPQPSPRSGGERESGSVQMHLCHPNPFFDLTNFRVAPDCHAETLILLNGSA